MPLIVSFSISEIVDSFAQRKFHFWRVDIWSSIRDVSGEMTRIIVLLSVDTMVGMTMSNVFQNPVGNNPKTFLPFITDKATCICSSLASIFILCPTLFKSNLLLTSWTSIIYNFFPRQVCMSLSLIRKWLRPVQIVIIYSGKNKTIADISDFLLKMLYIIAVRQLETCCRNWQGQILPQ